MEDVRRKLSSNPFAYDYIVNIIIDRDFVHLLNLGEKYSSYFEAMDRIRYVVKSLEKDEYGLIAEKITFRYKSKDITDGICFVNLLRGFIQTYNCNSHIRLNIERSNFECVI